MLSEYLTAEGEHEFVDGDIRTDDSPRSDVLLVLRTPYGSCPLAPTFGDRTFTIQKMTRSAPRLAETFTKQALTHLVDAGRLPDLEVKATPVGRALRRVVSYRVGKKRESIEVRTPIGG